MTSIVANSRVRRLCTPFRGSYAERVQPVWMQEPFRVDSRNGSTLRPEEAPAANRVTGSETLVQSRSVAISGRRGSVSLALTWQAP